MAFINALASYGIVLLVFVLAGGAAIFFGISMRKKKDAKLPLEVQDAEKGNEKG